MATVSEFARLVSELHKKPDDASLKQAVVRNLPQMMALAKDDSFAMFHLAQSHSPTSAQYKQMMRQSAAMGCTNAMLASCQLLLKTGAEADLKTAAHYMKMIEKSGDSYIIKQARSLLETHPQLAAEMRPQSKAGSYNSGHRFFASAQGRKVDDAVEMENQMVI